MGYNNFFEYYDETNTGQRNTEVVISGTYF